VARAGSFDVKPAKAALKKKEDGSPGGATAMLATVVLVAGLTMAFAVRLRLADMPLERDEGEYAYAGQLILEGVPPYTEMYNMKLPGTYYAYAAILRVFGQTPRGIHLGLAVWTTVSALLVFLIARRLLDNVAAAVAAAAFAVLSAGPMILGLAGHATHFVTLPALVGGLLLLRADERDSVIETALAGLAFGIAFLMKQHAVVLVAFGLLYTAMASRRRARSSLGKTASRSAVFAACAAVPYVFLLFYVWKHGALESFWFWTVTYAREYVSALPVAASWLNFKETVSRIVRWNAALWLLAVVGVGAMVRARAEAPVRWFVLGYLAFSFLAVCPGGQFRKHYFIVMLPALGWLVGASIAPLRGLFGRAAGTRGAALLAAVIVAGAFALALVGQGGLMFRSSADDVVRALYAGNPFVESVEIGRWIREHSRAGERIAVLGSEPQLYFYAHRRAATRYPYTYALMEEHPFAARLQAEFMREIETARPKIVVVVAVATSWLVRDRSDLTILQRAFDFIRNDYELAGAVDISGAGPSRIVWNPPQSWRPSTPNYTTILRARGKGSELQ
jgi:4-amino-4-deoxy-L-arabinose transferase-like glycosyltransferase